MNVIVTGNRTGIGKALSNKLLQDGHTVIGCSRSESEIIHDQYKHYLLDVASEKDVQKMIIDLKLKKIHIDVLINNAGTSAMNHLLLTPFDTVKKIFETNFFGTFLFTREVSKIMSRQKMGNIINISSIAVSLNLEGESIYAASKAAIESFTKTISKELSSFNINVNCIAPGPINTNLTKTLSLEQVKQVRNKQTIKRETTADDIYNVIKFLIGENGKFITGHVFNPGGVN